jgi:hypothetical protein
LCGGLVGGEGEWKRIRWRNRVDGLHLFIWNRTKKCLAIALSGGEGIEGERWWEWSNQHTLSAYPSCHNESPSAMNTS